VMPANGQIHFVEDVKAIEGAEAVSDLINKSILCGFRIDGV
jgi:hypothetical protein